MRDQCELYTLLSRMDVSERMTTPELLTNGTRHLVGDVTVCRFAAPVLSISINYVPVV